MSAPTRAMYRGRIAPSPTGLLHLGHARTFWQAYCRARDAGGVLVFRNEDLDPQRSRPEYAAAMLEDLRWMGIHWQEGPDVGGAFAPYEQGRRRDFYVSVWRKLLAAGWLYPCTCSRKDLAEAAAAPHEPEASDGLVYSGRCRGNEVPAGSGNDPRGHNWRFRVTDGEEVSFEDGGQGQQRFTAGRDFGDFIVWRRDDVPAYQLACVADDAAMKITEVVRGADLLRSTARQLLLFRALGLAPPAWYHCDLMTDGSGARLAKRHDALSLRALRAAGHSPEQVRRALDDPEARAMLAR